MKTLQQIHDEIGGMDRGKDQHDYLRHYEKLFEPIRHKPIRFLEIGVEFGLSARMWTEYFPNAEIHGVDITDHNVRMPRFTFHQLDQRSLKEWITFLDRNDGRWDVIIDDGCHHTSGIATSFGILWHRLASLGVYCVEDLMCGYHASCDEPGWPRQVEWLKSLVDEMNAQTKYVNTPEKRVFPNPVSDAWGIESITFSEELCIIRKK